ncbi:hypothetical protein ACEQ8H_005878 [Pleosporales sp. CAS-2024a]
MRFLSLVSTVVLSVAAAATLGKRAVTPGTLSQVTDFGTQPTNASFYLYVPKNLAASPGVIVAIHYCGGSAGAYYRGTPYHSLSEQYGFLVIYPSSPGTCWDVSSKATLTHNGGGDSNTIANMVTWTLDNYEADAAKVFVTGSSSGAMMTNVMAATYPELFNAAVVYSGVPAGCFASSSNAVRAWNNTCAQGQSVATPEAWANVVFNMYSGYNSTRPKMLIYHGSDDPILLPPNYQETMKQWCGVFGYDYSQPASIQQDTPQTNYTTTIWGPNVEGIYGTGVGHSVPIRGSDDMKWFGFA